MNLTDRELQLAKEALAKARAKTPLGNLPRETMTEEEKYHADKYPKHTLQEAKEIGLTPRPSWDGYMSGFERIRWQENHGTSHLSGDHT